MDYVQNMLHLTQNVTQSVKNNSFRKNVNILILYVNSQDSLIHFYAILRLRKGCFRYELVLSIHFQRLMIECMLCVLPP